MHTLTFFISVLGSLIGSALLLVLLSLFSKRARWVFTAILGRILDVDVEYVFKNKTDSLTDLTAEINRATELLFLASRGQELQREAFLSIFESRPQKRNLRVRLLLPTTALPLGHYDWTAQREHELAQFDTSFVDNLLHKQIETNIQFLMPHVRNGLVELRRYNFPHIGRIVMTDRCVYFTPYRHDSHGRDSRVYKFRRGGEMYDNYRRYFEQIWQVGEDQAQENMPLASDAAQQSLATEPGAESVSNGQSSPPAR